MMDDFSGYTILTFLKNKEGFIKPLCQYLSKLSKDSMLDEYVRMNMSGENKEFVEHTNNADW